jgi:hypothetical protein
LNAKDYAYAETVPDYGDKKLHEREAYDINQHSVGVEGEGLAQIQRLTKSVARIGYPQQLENLVGSCPDAEFIEHELVK